ncbi:Protein bem46 [Zancudomyces culisetae]|uniref:Protein bem46 n=1 Tax=Zancudomyces culisetae TaxID=1213189 RepID=A0A1R1PX31_ZANCU|nr:Protein bem46 [Zancudomyces culisetae]|eukprot:OMH85484.1 Protein bem46 [Zancudomyces culisetae]
MVFKVLGGMAVTVSICSLIALWYFQRDLIYPSNVPEKSRENVDLPTRYNMPHFEDVKIKTDDGVTIRGYLITRESPGESKKAHTLVYLHANAGNMIFVVGTTTPKLSFPINNYNWLMNIDIPFHSILGDVWLRGKKGVFLGSEYGLSEGKASEDGIKKDVDAAIQYLRSHPLVSESKFILYGQSIGGAVAIDTAARYQSEVSGLILENTFTSLPDIFSSLMPYLRTFKFMVCEKWNSKEQIKSIKKIPILFLAGGKDELVPPIHMTKLYNVALAYSENEVEFHSFPEGNHNDTCTQAGYFERVLRWWIKYFEKQD